MKILFMVDNDKAIFNGNFIYGKQRWKFSPPNRNLKGNFVFFCIVYCKMYVGETVFWKCLKSS